MQFTSFGQILITFFLQILKWFAHIVETLAIYKNFYCISKRKQNNNFIWGLKMVFQ